MTKQSDVQEAERPYRTILFPEASINHLKLNLCLSSWTGWTHRASNYLHHMKDCMNAISASNRYLYSCYGQSQAILT